ncbi:MAG: peptide chain release factor N(5)-glutamine methyltransferase [Planctomycetota bacterium]|jgi:release factor glutamine methyltransferase
MTAPTPPPVSTPDHAEAKVWRTAELLRWIRDHLDARGVDNPRVCAELLLSSVFACDRLRLYMEPQRPASEAERTRLRELVARAARHEPVQHLVGEAWFLARPFHVASEVLVPRPATETLVGEALAWIRGRPAEETVRALDLGTGSGCIAISLALDARTPERRSDAWLATLEARAAEAASARAGTDETAGDDPLATMSSPNADAELESAEDAATAPDPAPSRLRAGPSIEVVATDLEPGAIGIARRNAARHEVSERVEFAVGDLFEPVAGRRFDLICANPPYIDDARWAEVPANVRFEPEVALRGGSDGLAVLRRLVAAAPEHLRPGGAILLEFQFDQAARIRDLLAESGFEGIRIVPDHEGHDRVAVARRPE